MKEAPSSTNFPRPSKRGKLTPLAIEISGSHASGEPATVSVRIPHPFTYLLMKLTAYRDRRNDPDKDLGRHHALDIFRIVAMLTESERDEVLERVRRFSENAQVRSCSQWVRSDFAHTTSEGMLAMRAHPLWNQDPHMDLFLETLNELLP